MLWHFLYFPLFRQYLLKILASGKKKNPFYYHLQICVYLLNCFREQTVWAYFKWPNAYLSVRFSPLTSYDLICGNIHKSYIYCIRKEPNPFIYFMAMGIKIIIVNISISFHKAAASLWSLRIVLNLWVELKVIMLTQIYSLSSYIRNILLKWYLQWRRYLGTNL